MLATKSKTDQSNIFYTKLSELIDPKHELCLLAEKIPWQELEDCFKSHYRLDFGRPGKNIRLMVSILILKHLYNQSDENVVSRWAENPYWQSFSGEEYFQWSLPCDPTELSKFRNRIGVEGVEKIFEISIKVQGKKALEPELIPDTTVQEKNITFPTDTKLALKVIAHLLKLCKSHGVKLRRSYKREIKKLRFLSRYARRGKRAKEGKKAIKRIKTIAGLLYRESLRKLPKEAQLANARKLAIMERILTQKKEDKNKIYSLHEPEVSCIAKGKEHKKYEFGSKASVLITKKSGIIVGAKSFQGNPYDGNTLESALEQAERLRGVKAKYAIVDEGYRGRAKINETEILRVHQPKKIKFSKVKWRGWFKRRASVEGKISHLKHDYRVNRNYLKGVEGDSINLLLAASAYNFRILMRDLIFIFKILKVYFFKNFDFIFLKAA